MNTSNCTRLHVFCFGLAIGLTWAIGVFLMGISGYFAQVNPQITQLMGQIYIGFEPTIKGSLIGALWGFLDGLITGILIAFFYNAFSRCCRWKRCCGEPKQPETPVKPTPPMGLG